MKAKEYFEKYDEPIMNQEQYDNVVKATRELLAALLDESMELVKSRHVRTDSGVGNVLREMNLKWNCICGLFEKKYGESPLLKDGFKNYLISTVPELADLFKKTPSGIGGIGGSK